MVNKRLLDHLLYFIHKCNRITTDGSDYNIVQAVYRHIGSTEFPTQEELAAEANVSSSSLMRFIRTFKFDNYEAFKGVMGLFAVSAYLDLQLLTEKRFPQMEERVISDSLFEASIRNLTETHNRMDYAKLKQIIHFFRTASDIIFVGDARDMDAFDILQIALLTSGKAASMYHIGKTRQRNAREITEDTVVVFINTAKSFFNSMDVLPEALENHARIVIFTQDDLDCDTGDALIYRFGVPGSNTEGYNSLTYLADVLRAMYLKDDPGTE